MQTALAFFGPGDLGVVKGRTSYPAHRNRPLLVKAGRARMGTLMGAHGQAHGRAWAVLRLATSWRKDRASTVDR